MPWVEPLSRPVGEATALTSDIAPDIAPNSASDSASAMASAVDPATVRAIVAACLQAPSGDNCQPWRFAWDGRVLAIRHDHERARHPINRGDHGSLLTLGCVVESASITATTHGLRARVTYGEGVIGGAAGVTAPTGHGSVDGPEPWATVRFVADPTVDVDILAAAISRRCTDRRAYLGGEFDASMTAALASDGVGAARVRVASAPDDAAIAYARAAESSLLADPVAFAAVMAWVRFSRREALARRDGMPLANLGIRFFEVPMLRLLRSAPWLVRPLAACGMKAMQERTIERRLTGTGHATVVDAGRAAMRAWLRLTTAGFGVQPLSLSSLYAFLASATGLIEPDAAPFFRNGGEILRRTFGMDAGERPIWMFRAGVSPAMPESMRTLRRPVGEVLEFS